MSVTIKLAAGVLALAGLAGCVSSPEQLESTPVEVKTNKGTVTCQLYTREYLSWDRSVDRPGKMTVKEADSVCRQAGLRWQQS